MKCHNALKLLKRPYNIQNGNNIEQLREKNSIITRQLENHVGNCPMKLNNTGFDLKKKEKKKDKKMEENYCNNNI
jgi:hypothetical protein